MLKYKYIIIPFITLALAQGTKLLTEAIKMKKFDLSRLSSGNGGMPSSHTAFTVSLAFTLGFDIGFDSPIFAASLIFSIIVAYDAMGLRMESGRHAEKINVLMEKNNIKQTKLNEKIGHKPLEVITGFIFGIISAFVFIHILT